MDKTKKEKLIKVNEFLTKATVALKDIEITNSMQSYEMFSILDNMHKVGRSISILKKI